MTVEWKGDEFVKRSLIPSIQDGLKAAGLTLQVEIQRSIGGPSPSLPGTPPGRDTSTLATSVTNEMTGPLSVGVGTNLKYAMALERGAVLRSKSGKWLTIPLNKEAKMMRRRHGSLREVTGLTFIKSKRGNLLLVKIVGGKNARTVPMFLLRKQATLLARPWLGPGLRNNAARVQREFSSATTKSLTRRAQLAFKGGA